MKIGAKSLGRHLAANFCPAAAPVVTLQLGPLVIQRCSGKLAVDFHQV
jgi:hypothetical protein